MPGYAKPWAPKEWEAHVQRLLKRRYMTPGTYQPIPDEVQGDYGLEGFATDGTAYQCYAPQGMLTSKVLLQRQKNKITADIAKFVRNEQDLLSILGAVRISIWNLVVPYWVDKDLLKHANKKAAEVRGQQVHHADTQFRIAVLTGEDFEVEAQQIAGVGLHSLDFDVPKVSDTALDQWIKNHKNLSLVENLQRKVGLMGQGKSRQQRSRFRSTQVRNYIAGNIVLGDLKRQLPDTFEMVDRVKAHKEASLETAIFASTDPPAAFLGKTLSNYEDELRAIPGISPRDARVLAQEAVADWLLRCPLDFE